MKSLNSSRHVSMNLQLGRVMWHRPPGLCGPSIRMKVQADQGIPHHYNNEYRISPTTDEHGSTRIPELQVPSARCVRQCPVLSLSMVLLSIRVSMLGSV